MDSNPDGGNGNLSHSISLSGDSNVGVHASLMFNFIPGSVPPPRANRVDDSPTFQGKSGGDPDFTDRTWSKQLRSLLQFGTCHPMDDATKSRPCEKARVCGIDDCIPLPSENIADLYADTGVNHRLAANRTGISLGCPP